MACSMPHQGKARQQGPSTAGSPCLAAALSKRRQEALQLVGYHYPRYM